MKKLRQQVKAFVKALRSEGILPKKIRNSRHAKGEVF